MTQVSDSKHLFGLLILVSAVTATFTCSPKEDEARYLTCISYNNTTTKKAIMFYLSDDHTAIKCVEYGKSLDEAKSFTILKDKTPVNFKKGGMARFKDPTPSWMQTSTRVEWPVNLKPIQNAKGLEISDVQDDNVTIRVNEVTASVHKSQLIALDSTKKDLFTYILSKAKKVKDTHSTYRDIINALWKHKSKHEVQCSNDPLETLMKTMGRVRFQVMRAKYEEAQRKTAEKEAREKIRKKYRKKKVTTSTKKNYWDTSNNLDRNYYNTEKARIMKINSQGLRESELAKLNKNYGKLFLS